MKVRIEFEHNRNILRAYVDPKGPYEISEEDYVRWDDAEQAFFRAQVAMLLLKFKIDNPTLARLFPGEPPSQDPVLIDFSKPED